MWSLTFNWRTEKVMAATERQKREGDFCDDLTFFKEINKR